MAILGELERGGLIDTSVGRIDSPNLKKTLDRFDIIRNGVSKIAENRDVGAFSRC